ncbi:MAG: DUF4428 domain-containing protein [Clostridium sp.]|nr:DUF4428 domain-containing protein [Clostridium sp.]
MGLFDKKYCDICGDKIGMLGNKKLEHGNMCKSCAKQLSPWFGGRRDSSIAEIKEQLAYREENKDRVREFNPTRKLGRDQRVLIDDNSKRFTVTSETDLSEENPDILDFHDVVKCEMDIHETQTELMREEPDGKKVIYNPRRFEYHYDFLITIKVNNPYFDEISFKLNRNRVDGQSRLDYDEFKQAGEEICIALSPSY